VRYEIRLVHGTYEKTVSVHPDDESAKVISTEETEET
jgi:hypothetical protein